uniref:Methylosome subunit pICln n=1 Tax=Anopheles maculatus TaxID=74869 RepID=A0A182T3D9_9DIPT
MVTIGEAFTPTEGIIYSASDVKLKMGLNLIPSPGMLHLTESSCIWSCEERNASISIPWPRVGAHAISSVPGEGIFLMVDVNIVWPGFYTGYPENNGDAHPEELGEENDEGHDSEISDGAITEMWLQPASREIVDQIFSAMRECQILNPGSDVSEDEDYMEAEEDELEEVEDMRNLQLDDEDKFADAEE